LHVKAEFGLLALESGATFAGQIEWH